MRTGLVRKILDYYFTTEAFRCETERAFKEFFDLKDISLLAKIKMTDAKSNHFNEWFLYDFRLRNNKSSLENFCETDPENWDDEDIKAAKDLLINEYGAYEVLEIEPGTGLKIQNLQSKNIYDVKEHKATFQLVGGFVLFGRVGRVDDHWELIGCDSLMIATSFTSSAKKLLFGKMDRVTPKTAIEIIDRK